MSLDMLCLKCFLEYVLTVRICQFNTHRSVLISTELKLAKYTVEIKIFIQLHLATMMKPVWTASKVDLDIESCIGIRRHSVLWQPSVPFRDCMLVRHY